MASNVAVLEFGDGKLNPLGARARNEIHSKLEKFKAMDSVTSVVLVGKGGRQFSAGADMTEFGIPPTDVISMAGLTHYVESYPKPIVAAIAGVALGGGLELALSCHYRVADPQTAKLGLPEVQVGVIPGAGGTQRLPRLLGVEKALKMVLNGIQITGPTALDWKLVDGLKNPKQSLIDCGTQWASWAELMPLSRACDISLDRAHVETLCDNVKKTLPSAEQGGFGVHAALKAIRASSNFETGMETENELFWETVGHPQGKARQHAFFAIRTAQKGKPIKNWNHPLITKQGSTTVGVVGAGLMGSGIAIVLLQSGFTVRLVDINEKALQKGVAFLKRTAASYVKRGKWSLKKAESINKALKPTTKLTELKDCVLVVEAVLENLNIKRKIFETLNRVAPQNALLLSNTSSLSIDSIALALSHERRPFCAGWHFFSPAHKMKLVEIVVGEESSDETISILQNLTKRIGKIGVVVGNCDGFVGNRMFNNYTGEASFLLSEGVASVQYVDNALTKIHGMALGPFQVGDLAGNEIGYYIRKEKGIIRDTNTNQIGPNRGNMRYSELGDDLVTKLGRHGHKTGKGWYDYDPKIGKGRKGIPSEEVSKFIQQYHPRIKKAPLTPQEIIERVLFPLVNEGFKILEEGHAQRPSDIDVVYIYGYGWPVWRGGPMFWADHEVGLPYLLQQLQRFEKQFSGSDYFKPSQLLETCVKLGVTLEKYYKKKQQNSHRIKSRL